MTMLRKKSKLSFISISLAVILLGGIIYFIIGQFNQPLNEDEIILFPDDNILPVEAVTKFPRALDGALVYPGKEHFMPFGVMIENHFESRPQSGLEDASIVFEALVEGGITRFLAIFDSGEKLSEIGPVRSARPYFLEWIKGLDVPYLHVGGSPEALEKIDTYAINNINQFYEFQYYWRSPDRLAPHNVYTSSNLIDLAFRDKGIEKENAEFETWLFKDPTSSDEIYGDTNNIIINFSKPIYNVVWNYSQSQNVYVRMYGDELHLSADGEAIKADNIVILYTNIEVIDEEGRRHIKTIGTGRAVAFRDGQRFEDMTWSKYERDKRIRFYTYDGEEFVFNRGKIWIEVISDDIEISY